MAEFKLDNDALVCRINDYIARAGYDKKVVSFPLEQEGVFRVIGAAPFGRGQYSDAYRGYVLPHDTVKGRFIDALVFAFNHPDFYSDRRPELYEGSDTTLQGYIELAKIEELPKKFNIKLLTKAQVKV